MVLKYRKKIRELVNLAALGLLRFYFAFRFKILYAWDKTAHILFNKDTVFIIRIKHALYYNTHIIFLYIAVKFLI